MSGEIKKTGSPVKNFVNRLNKAFETENVLSAPKGLTDALNETTTSEQTGSDAFGASRKLLASPNKSKNAVRNALDEAALKLSSVGTNLQETPRPLRAAGDDEWTLSTENPVFSEVNTPREHSSNTSTKNTPAKAGNDANNNIVSPTRSTPRSARTPGSAQKDDANGFPRSFPVAKPVASHGLQGGLAGWMRKSSNLANGEETILGTPDAESDAGDSNTTVGGLGVVLLMFLALVLVIGVAFFMPTASFPASVGVRLDNFRHQAATLTAPYSSQLKSAGNALLTSPTSANVVALVHKVPQIPRITSTNFPLSDLRWRAMVSAVKDGSAFRSSSSDTAVQELKSARQVAIDAVQTPLKLLGSAIAGVCLAVTMVAAVLQFQGAMPLSSLAVFKSFSTVGAAPAAGGYYTSPNNLIDTLEFEEEPATTTRRGAAIRRGTARKAAAGATPRSSRRLVSDDVDGGNGGRASTSSARKSWRRQDTE